MAQGQEVSLLALLDTWGKGFPSVRPLPWRILDHLEHLGTLRTHEQRTYLAEKAAALRRQFAFAIGWPGAENPTLHSGHECAEIVAINHEAWIRYQPRPYPGCLVLFRAEQTPNWVGTRFDDPLMGWGSLAIRGVTTHTVPANHWNLLHRENVPPLARVLNSYLRE
jgi:thioesterase domain-containing protein